MSMVAIVTGANKGIGFAIVKGLADRFKGLVFLTARNEERGMAAVNELKDQGKNVIFHPLDTTSKASIEKFRHYIESNYEGIDILVNNAGTSFKNSDTEPMNVQAEVTLGTNYFGTKQTCEILFPLLKAGARVVNMSSSKGFLAEINGDEPAAEKLRKKLASSDSSLTVRQLDNIMNSFIKATSDGSFKAMGWGGNTYAVSKVGLSALTRIQQRTLSKDQRKDIVINHVHPGYSDTDMTSHGEFETPEKPLTKTPEQGAVSSIYCSLLPRDTKIKGQYIWHDCQIVDWVHGPKPKM